MADEISTGLTKAAREREAREQGSHDPRWQKLVKGDLSLREEATLRAEAEAPDAADRTRRGYEAFRPLGAEFRARMTAAISRELAREGEHGAHGEARSDAMGDTQSDATAANENHDSGAGKEPAERGASFALPLVAAAVVVLAFAAAWMLRTRSEPLPGYEIEIGGFVKTDMGTRDSADLPTLVFHSQSRLEISLTPVGAVAGDIAVRTFLEHDHGLDLLELESEIFPDGVVRSQRIVESLAPPAGNHRLVIVVGRPAKLPDANQLEEILRRHRPSISKSWQLFTRQVQFDPVP
jgi:hypothetical protein